MIAPAKNPVATGQRKKTRHTTNPTAAAATMYLRIRFSAPAKNSSAPEEVGSSIVVGTHQCTAQTARTKIIHQRDTERTEFSFFIEVLRDLRRSGVDRSEERRVGKEC